MMSGDAEFARNLARSMKEGYGRHNSNLDFNGRGALLVFDEALVRCVSRGTQVRERWEDCAVGEMVSEEKFKPIGNLPFEFRMPRREVSRIMEDGDLEAMVPALRWMFERVRMITADNSPFDFYWRRTE